MFKRYLCDIFTLHNLRSKQTDSKVHNRKQTYGSYKPQVIEKITLNMTLSEILIQCLLLHV